MQLRVVPMGNLAPDPDVQLAFTFDERRVERMVSQFDEDLLGVLVVTPNGSEDHFNIIDGRHRHAAALRVGLTAMRCDVIHDRLTVSEKAALKMGYDRDRRHVSALEHFLEEVLASDPEACEISNVLTGVGYRVAKTRNGKPADAVEAVSTLRRIYRTMGPEKLHRTMVLATTWKNDPKANCGTWIGALSLLVRDGYDEMMTPKKWATFKEQAPAVVIRRAQGDVQSLASGNASTASAIEYAVAIRLRQIARLKLRDAQGDPKGVRRKPLTVPSRRTVVS